MASLFYGNYLSRRPIELAMQKFAREFSSEKKILDIGCGNKPYKRFFHCTYVGLDPLKETGADVIAQAWEIPFPDNEFDGVILNQSLEHIKKLDETISEIRRVLKSEGLGIITAPQTVKIHSQTMSSQISEYNNFDKTKIKYWNVDFFRFTKFGLIHLFRDFQILELKETNGYFGTLFQQLIYFQVSLTPIKIIFMPLNFVFGLLGMIFDNFFKFLNTFGNKLYGRFYEIIYLSLTLNYIMIIKNSKK